MRLLVSIVLQPELPQNDLFDGFIHFVFGKR